MDIRKNDKIRSMETMDEWQKKLEPLACEVLEESRAHLMLSHRYLNVALWHMPFKPGYPTGVMATDGKNLYFDTLAVISYFQENPNKVIREMLHSIVHCIFRQPFDTVHTNPPAWDLVSDIMCERLAMDMSAGRYEDPDDKKRAALWESFVRTYGDLNPEQMYRLFADSYDATIDPQLRAEILAAGHRIAPVPELRELEIAFRRDDHMGWYMHREANDDEKDGDNMIANDAQSEDQDENQKQEQNKDQRPDSSDSQKDKNDEQNERDRKDWEDLAKQIQAELELQNKDREEGDPVLIRIMQANQRRYNYRDFLRKFAAIREDMVINDDEFDYIYYTYGLDLFGNMPLVEPLEYKEIERVRSFVIALDTSGSVKGELLENFVHRTCEILCESAIFGTKVEIHIIQCDAEIHEDIILHDMEELKAYLNTFEVRGFGGTDFRPVFDYVDQLQNRGELKELKGLIYFTDGEGVFPKKPAPYQTAFVFMQTTPALTFVPPWAMKVVLTEDQLIEC